jgi:hypothetical protein
MNNLLALSKVLGEYELHKNEALFFCFAHHHHKPKLSVNIDNDLWKCWVCERGGRNIYHLLKLKGETEDSREYKKLHLNKKQEKEKKKQYVKPVLPKEYRTLSKEWRSPYYDKAINYLQSRGITTEDILRYKIGYAEDGDFAYRIIFPSFDANGDLNFVVGRDYIFNKFPKYYHLEYDKDIIFNEYLINWDKPITLVEGVIDSVKAGENSIPIQGSWLAEESYLFKKLIFSDSDVYLSLDKDADKKQYKLAKQFLEHGKEVKIIKLSENDPGNMTKDQFLFCKENAINVKNNFDLLRERI